MVLDYTDTRFKKNIFFEVESQASWGSFSQNPGERKKMTDKKNVTETYVPDNFRLNSWLLKTELSMGAKLAYSVLANCCNGRDHAWPSQDYLARCLSISVRTVQRYLKELVGYGLIKISRKHLMGQTRSIYVFLNNALVSFEAEKVPTMRKRRGKKAGNPDLAKATKSTSGEASKTTNQGDKNSTSHNKEDSFVDNNINLPPTPQKAASLFEAEMQPADAGLDEGENVPTPKENPEDASPWGKVKRLLARRLSETNLKTWIEPMNFEPQGIEAVLRVPNEFYRKWVLQYYGQELTEAFQTVGFSGLRFELLTQEQRAALEAKEMARAEQEAQKKAAAVIAAAEAEQRSQAEIESLPPASKFDLLFSAYPVDKEREEAERIFMRLYRKGELPSMSELFRSIKDHQAHDRWWREKMPPLLSNWLSKKKWRDKPYE